MDYEKLDNILQKKLTDMSQISLWDTLTIEDYYCTDTHWRQERLQPVVDRIGEQLDFSIDLSTLRKESISFLWRILWTICIATTTGYDMLLYR